MTFTISNLIDFTAIIAMLVLIGILILVPKPKGEAWHAFRSSLNYLIAAFFVLAIANVPTFFNNDVDPILQGAIVISVAAYQALLFSAVTIVMLSPRSYFIKLIPLQLVIISIMSAGLIFSAIELPSLFFPWFSGVAIMSYALLCAYYTKVFWTLYHNTQKRLEEYYDDDMNNRIVWMRRLFFSALFVGVLAIVASVWAPFYPPFTLIAVVFYVYLLSCMLRYIITANYLVDAVSEESDTKEEETECLSPSEIDVHEKSLEERLAKWVANKEYTKTDVSVDEIARQLNATYAELCHYFSNVKGTTFRNWRTQLRIEESKQLMREKPDLSISEIAILSGFNDRGNYHRAFQKSESQTPSEYRENIK